MTFKQQQLNKTNLNNYKKYILMVDTETVGNIDSCLPYDISVKVYNLQKKQVVFQQTYIIKELFENKVLMSTAYFACKIPFYENELNNYSKNFILLDSKNVLEELNKIIALYNISIMSAYNSNFDYNTINRLYDLAQVKNKFKNLLQLDIWQLVLEYFELDKNTFNNYKNFAKSNNLVTEKGTNYQSNVESLTKWLSQNINFIEHHTGLSDIANEIDILNWVVNRYKKLNLKCLYKLNKPLEKRKYFFKNGLLNVE